MEGAKYVGAVEHQAVVTSAQLITAGVKPVAAPPAPVVGVNEPQVPPTVAPAPGG